MPLRRDSFKFISSKLSTISFQLLCNKEKNPRYSTRGPTASIGDRSGAPLTSMTPSGSIPSGPPWSLWENNASVSDGPVTDRPSRCSGTVPAGRPDALPEPSAHRTNVPRLPPPFPGAPAGGGGEMAAAAQCELRRSAGRQRGRGGGGGEEGGRGEREPPAALRYPHPSASASLARAPPLGLRKSGTAGGEGGRRRHSASRPRLSPAPRTWPRLPPGLKAGARGGKGRNRWRKIKREISTRNKSAAVTSRSAQGWIGSKTSPFLEIGSCEGDQQ